jgi:hypothetical protein
MNEINESITNINSTGRALHELASSLYAVGQDRLADRIVASAHTVIESGNRISRAIAKDLSKQVSAQRDGVIDMIKLVGGK